MNEDDNIHPTAPTPTPTPTPTLTTTNSSELTISNVIKCDDEQDNPNDSYKDDTLWVDILPKLPSIQDCFEFCAADPSCGAVASFVGITRNHFESKQVLHLSYEAYDSMARKVLYQICFQARKLYPGVSRMVALHLIGDCPVGNASVILVCSSPHRQEALDATEFMIHDLKAKVPIWKREVYLEPRPQPPADNANDRLEDAKTECAQQPRLTSVWKENPEWHEGKMKRVMEKEK